SPELAVVKLARNASLIVVDRGYLKTQRQWRQYVAENVKVPLIQVESDVVVPVEEASSKEEFSAATFRPKILRKLDRYLVSMKKGRP
ncbi:MAG: deoxyribodipyrimidine photolyase, partial [Candidatus Aenigmarchaeota archaeon]|nr:deoxyribodipyrimidine photolyase [Candidatus Aenigmarchaeota archaeon]